MNRAMSSSRKVSVSLSCVAQRLGPGPAAAAGRHDALDDEPVGRLDEQDLVHPALVDERADRPEDLLEVLARASLVDPHRASSLRRVPASGPADQEPVVWSSSPRSFARRSLARKTAIAASVASVPVTSKATTIVGGVRRGCPGDGWSTAIPSPPIDGEPAREERLPDALDPPAERVSRPIDLDGVGQHDEREHRAADQEQRAGDRLRVGPRLLAGLEADRGQHHADRDDRRQARATMTTTSSGQWTAREVERDAEHDDADDERDHARPSPPTATRATPRPSSTTRKSLGLTYEVLEHPVALAVVEDRPGEPGDPGHDERPQRAAEDDECPVLRVDRRRR